MASTLMDAPQGTVDRVEQAMDYYAQCSTLMEQHVRQHGRSATTERDDSTRVVPAAFKAKLHGLLEAIAEDETDFARLGLHAALNLLQAVVLVHDAGVPVCASCHAYFAERVSHVVNYTALTAFMKDVSSRVPRGEDGLVQKVQVAKAARVVLAFFCPLRTETPAVGERFVIQYLQYTSLERLLTNFLGPATGRTVEGIGAIEDTSGIPTPYRVWMRLFDAVVVRLDLHGSSLARKCQASSAKDFRELVIRCGEQHGRRPFDEESAVVALHLYHDVLMPLIVNDLLDCHASFTAGCHMAMYYIRKANPRFGHCVHGHIIAKGCRRFLTRGHATSYMSSVCGAVWQAMRHVANAVWDADAQEWRGGLSDRVLQSVRLTWRIGWMSLAELGPSSDVVARWLTSLLVEEEVDTAAAMRHVLGVAILTNAEARQEFLGEAPPERRTPASPHALDPWPASRLLRALWKVGCEATGCYPLEEASLEDRLRGTSLGDALRSDETWDAAARLDAAADGPGDTAAPLVEAPPPDRRLLEELDAADETLREHKMRQAERRRARKSRQQQRDRERREERDAKRRTQEEAALQERQRRVARMATDAMEAALRRGEACAQAGDWEDALATARHAMRRHHARCDPQVRRRCKEAIALWSGARAASAAEEGRAPEATAETEEQSAHADQSAAATNDEEQDDADHRHEESTAVAAYGGAADEEEEDRDPFRRLVDCPITCDRLVDPVVLVEDGHTYEREALVAWLARDAVSPLTGRRLRSTLVAPNHLLRALLQQGLGA